MPVINWSNVTDLSQLPSLANSASHDTFWSGMLVMMWVILFFMFTFFGWEVALVVSAFVGLSLSLPMAYTDLVSWNFVLVFAALLLTMFIYIVWRVPKIRQ